jgi:N-acetylglucosamine-6-phosphate deacetylase
VKLPDARLEQPGAWFGMIVDGEHVAPAMLRLALRGACHPMLVTDAMPLVGGTCTSFRLYGQDVMVSNGRCMMPDGTFAGSVLTMAGAVCNCVRLLNVPLVEPLPLASASPAAFLGVDDWLGRLAPGYRADMVAFDPDTVDIFGTWVAATPSATA